MIKQLFGSFFRTFGRIIAYLVFGALLALIFQYKDVFAAESVGYSKTEFTLYYRDNYYPNVSGQCNEYIAYSDFPDFTGWSALDSTLGNYNSTTGKQSLVGRIGFRIYGNSSNKYVAGNTYTVRFTIDFENEYFRDIFLQYYSPFYFRGNTTASMDGNSESYFDSYSTRKAAGSEPNRALVYITFTPNQDLLFLRFDMINASLIPINDPNKLTSNCHLVGGRVNYEYLQITYTAGVQGSIDNQTNVIKDQTDKLNNSLNNMLEFFQKSNEDTNDIYLNDTENPDGTCNGILCNLKKVVKAVINFPVTLVNAIIDGVKTLLIPENFDFLDDFRDSIESKLGFVAEVPMAMIEFLFLLGSYDVDEMDSIDFPEIDIFGYKFWNAQEIDLTEAINIFKPFKYITDVLCVIICINTLTKWRERFTGGGS